MKRLEMVLVSSVPIEVHRARTARLAAGTFGDSLGRVDPRLHAAALACGAAPAVFSPLGQCISRRDVLRRAGLATMAGLLLPGLPVLGGCEAAAELGRLVLAAILGFATEQAQYALSDVLSNSSSGQIQGPLELQNEKSAVVQGDADFELRFGEEVVDGGFGNYEVPGGTVNTYVWKGLTTDRSGDHQAVATTALNSKLAPFRVA